MSILTFFPCVTTTWSINSIGLKTHLFDRNPLSLFGWPRTFTLHQHKKTQEMYDHGDPPTDHAIIHISPHTWAITLKPFLFPSQHPYAPSDASAASVPLPIARPQPTSRRPTQTHANSGIHQLQTLSNSRWSHFTSNLNETTSPRFQIIRGSISYVLVDERWVLFTQA